MAPRVSVTESDLLDALAASQVSDAPKHARSAAEMADETGVAITTVNKALRALHRTGRVQSFMVRRPAVDGKMRPIPVYVIRPA